MRKGAMRRDVKARGELSHYRRPGARLTSKTGIVRKANKVSLLRRGAFSQRSWRWQTRWREGGAVAATLTTPVEGLLASACQRALCPSSHRESGGRVVTFADER
jgi:hypothetical protein